MSPTCLACDARLSVLRGVVKLLSLEHSRHEDDDPTLPEIAVRRDEIFLGWDEHERRARWLLAHSTSDNLRDIPGGGDFRRRRYSDRKFDQMTQAGLLPDRRAS